MTVALLTALIIVNLGFLWLLDRRDKRAFEDHQADRLERAGLLQRVQAPELAVTAHYAQESESVQRGVSEFMPPLSDEEIADNLATIQRMEREANRGLDPAWEGMT